MKTRRSPAAPYSEQPRDMNSNPVLPKLLVADDDELIVKQLQWALSDEYSVFPARDRHTALETIAKEDISVVLLDLGLPPHPRDAIEGLRTLEELIAVNPLVKVIIVSGNSERQNALRALERGAHDVFAKPVNIDELKIVLQRVYRRVQMEQESMQEQAFGQRVSFERMIGSSPAMKAVYSSITKVAQADVPVLILGESGTGKELVANAIHNLSARSKGPFGAINCGAIPEALLESELFGNEKGAFTGATMNRRGKLEYAQGGTLFLDEIGDLAPELQVKILRFLQEKVIERVGGREPIPVDCRVIAATHRDLDKAVKDCRFREDLYFRLAVVKISLPPLRERGDDILELSAHLIDSFSKELKKPPKKFSKTAMEAIRRHSWPGNVRELQNRIKRALVLAEGAFVNPSDLELAAPQDATTSNAWTLRAAREEFEREIIARRLQENSGNISRTARVLGISRPTLYELMTRYGLDWRSN
jgi:two-component system NtrC family response regulator